MISLADKLLRAITSKSPRLVCTRCNEAFLLASLNVRFTNEGTKDCCPRCGENGPFRSPTEDEAIAIVPERKHWWVIGPILVLLAAIFVASVWQGLT